MVKVLFVCMGNICRSPTAQGVFSQEVQARGLQQQISVDSAGTHAYHVGEPPDERARHAAAGRQIDLNPLRARQVEVTDFARFDYVLAMDQENLDLLLALCPDPVDGKVKLFMEFAPGLAENEVPDPYWGGARGFERVLDMTEAASRGLLDHIEKHDLKLRD